MYLDTLQPPFLDRGICLGIGPGFVHFWVELEEDEELIPSHPPLPVPGFSPSRGFGNWGGWGMPL